MKHRALFAFIVTIIIISLGIYFYTETGKYASMTLWILASPLALSYHPIFYQNASEMEISEKKYRQTKQWMQIARFSFAGFGILLFVFQLISDIG